MLGFHLVVLLSAQADHTKAEAALGSLHWRKLSRNSWMNDGAYLAPDRHSGLTCQNMPQRLRVVKIVWKVTADVIGLAHPQLGLETHRVLQHWFLVFLVARRQDAHSDSTHPGTLTQFREIHPGRPRPILELEA